jgi:hypothetical protein
MTRAQIWLEPFSFPRRAKPAWISSISAQFRRVARCKGMRTALAGIAAVVATAAALSAQTAPPPIAPRAPAAPQTPTRDTVVPPTTGTASVSGVVTVDEQALRPVRRVVLTLSGGGMRVGRVTVSDDDGRFFFGDLPAGRFNLTGAKPGFVTSHYGARRLWRGPGTPIELAPGQRIADLSFKILRGAVLTGTVRDPNGQPQSNLRIQVLENRVVGNELSWAPAMAVNSSSQTDDRGMYRVFGLPPGTYLVAVAGTPLSTAARLTSDAEVQWALQQAQAASRTAASAPGGSPQIPAPDAGPTVGYAPLYFPGTPEPAAATTVTLGPGEERTGIDLMMQFVPTARVTGLITGADGQPMPNVQVALVPQGRKTILSFDGAPRTGVDGNGRFMFQGVRPGQYTLLARAQNRPPAPPPPPAPMSDGYALAYAPRPDAGPNTFDQWAQIDLSVSGKDITEIRLTMQSGMSLSGRVVFEGVQESAPPDVSLVSVSMRPAPNQTVNFGQLPGSFPGANGTFSVSGVTPGLYLMSSNIVQRPNAPPPGSWVVKSIAVKGQDALEVPFEVGPNEHVTDIVVTYTNQVTDLSGQLVDGAGKPVAGYFVLVFPTTRSSWMPGSRRMRSPVRTSPDGRYRLANLPPGEYFIAALTEFDSLDLYDQKFLEEVAASSFKFTLAEGEKRAMDLKIAK